MHIGKQREVRDVSDRSCFIADSDSRNNKGRRVSGGLCLNGVYGPTNQVSLLIPLPTGVGAKIAAATTMASARQNRTRINPYP